MRSALAWQIKILETAGKPVVQCTDSKSGRDKTAITKEKVRKGESYNGRPWRKSELSRSKANWLIAEKLQPAGEKRQPQKIQYAARHIKKVEGSAW